VLAYVVAEGAPKVKLGGGLVPVEARVYD